MCEQQKTWCNDRVLILISDIPLLVPGQAREADPAWGPAESAASARFSAPGDCVRLSGVGPSDAAGDGNICKVASLDYTGPETNM
jgi:hypothetical protein